ncbi:hypothetical protein OG589_37865 [Sphaerisporangium sp. NBC_01403]
MPISWSGERRAFVITDRGHSLAARVQAQVRAMTTTDLRIMLDALKKER